jgi:hypothetical protein
MLFREITAGITTYKTTVCEPEEAIGDEHVTAPSTA